MGVPLISVTSVETLSKLALLFAGLADMFALPCNGLNVIASPFISFMEVYPALQYFKVQVHSQLVRYQCTLHNKDKMKTKTQLLMKVFAEDGLKFRN